MDDYPRYVCAFTSVCEEDAGYIPQYLAEAERLNLHFAIHLDKCSPSTVSALINHRLCVGYTREDRSYVEFDETHKQGVFDKAAETGVRWLMAWDIDETYGPHSSIWFIKDDNVFKNYDYINVRWLNLWEDTKHIRVDGPFQSGHRDKFFNNHVGHWKFRNKTVNGPKLLDFKGKPVEDKARRLDMHSFVCLHYGMMTHDLRVQHKERWDRIYTKAVGRNPYGFWNYAIDPNNDPVVVPLEQYLAQNHIR